MSDDRTLTIAAVLYVLAFGAALLAVHYVFGPSP